MSDFFKFSGQVLGFYKVLKSGGLGLSVYSIFI